MKHTKRSAFTIVELVIVIAVIAILSAVLIPTFGGIIKNANVAADQTAAATLTTELQIWLKGGKVDSEAKLVEGIKAIDPDGKKLVPKALSYGYHFWFDMETQTIYAMTPDEVVEARPADTGSEASGMRNIYNNGYYLVDADGVINSMFGDMAAIDTKAEYVAYYNALVAAVEDKTYGALAEKVLDNFKKTTLRTSGGIFFFAEATSGNIEYYTPGIKVLVAEKYAYNPEDGTFNHTATVPAPAENKTTLPSSVLLVMADALDFGEGNTVVVNTKLSGAEALAGVFAPLSTDAVITDKNGIEYKIDQVADPDDGHDADRLVLESDGSWQADLVMRLPFEDYTIGYTTEEGLVEFNTDTLYISNLVNNRVVLFADDVASDETSLCVYKWTSDNDAISIIGGVISFDEDAVIAGSHRATITAYAKNVLGEEIVKTIKVEIRIVESATVTIDGYPYPLTEGGEHHLSYYVDGNNQSITLTPSIGWKRVVGEDLYDLRDAELKITKGDDTTTTNGTVEFSLNDTEYSFTVTVDGRLATTFTVAIVNLDASPYKLKFHHSRNHSPYYIGSGDSIKLSDLFYTESGFNFEGATLTVYGFAEDGTGLYSVYEINNYRKNQGKLVWADYESKINSDWANAEIKFNTDANYDHNSSAVTDYYDVVIEITPKNDVAMLVHVVIVADAKNVNKNTAASKLYTSHTASVVLHDDLAVATGDKINLGGQNMYGNGYVMNATTYKSSKGDNDLTDSLISVSGGTIDNIYLEGPVYPVLNYDHNKDDFYVSGVQTEANSTIINSYVSGFRQPVRNTSGTLSVTNTTLRGGNYANLLLSDGNLNLTNVTTVQDQNGMANTVATDKIAVGATRVTGMGIGLERNALDAKITIKGYLDQYNWIKNGQTANLPSLTTSGVSLNVNELFGFIFNGINASIFGISAQVDMGSVKYFINQDPTQNATSRTEGYVHAGIVFGELGSGAPSWTESVTIDESGRTDGTIKKRSFDKLSLLFSKTGLEIGGVMVYSAQNYFETDGLVIFWSHQDNRAWAPETDSKVQIMLKRRRLVNPTGGKVNANNPIIQIGTADYPIEYYGYDYSN